MPLFPAAKLFDMVIGVDMHLKAPLPPPAIPIDPFFGPIYLWHTPKFPMANVFINGMPAVGVGAMGYYMHIPLGVPANPPNTPYWKRYLMNIAMGFTLVTLTTFANLAIAGIAALIPKPKCCEDFIRDVTGIDTTNEMTTLNTISSSFSALIQWSTWGKLLMPPLPYPGSQGSVAVGSPNVTVNGGPLAFAGPLLATSCSDIPVMPNANTLGFSNVMVGMTFAQLARAIAVSTAQAGISAGIGAGLGRMNRSTTDQDH